MFEVGKNYYCVTRDPNPFDSTIRLLYAKLDQMDNNIPRKVSTVKSILPDKRFKKQNFILYIPYELFETEEEAKFYYDTRIEEKQLRKL